MARFLSMLNHRFSSSWYRELCMKPSKNQLENDENEEQQESSWRPGPQLISTKMRVVPKLLRLTWLGYPLHYDEKYGWGYLVPGLTVDKSENSQDEIHFPYEQIKQVCAQTKPSERSVSNLELEEINERLKVLEKEIEQVEDKPDGYLFMESLLQQQQRLIARRQKLLPSGTTCPIHQGNGPFPVPNVPGCWFFKIPHKVD